jgi:putative transposase
VRGVLREGIDVKYAFIERNRRHWPVSVLCEVLEVSPSGYHQRRQRTAQDKPHRTRVSDDALLANIKAIHAQVKGEYGWPRMWKELLALGVRVGKERVRKLMAQHGIRARHKRKYIATTNSNHDLPVAPNLLERNFTATAPNQVWTSDITYLATAEGWVYLAVIIDLFSRQVVGWSMQPHMKAELVTDALRMAWFRRRPQAGVIVHSDRGSQYCSGLFQDTLKAYGMRSSMSRRGDCWDTQSKIAPERRADLTRAGIGRAALALTLSIGFRRSPSVAGLTVCDLIGALYCTVSVLSCEWGWRCAYYNGYMHGTKRSDSGR